LHGSFTLTPGVEGKGKSFDFMVGNPNSEILGHSGIYDFEGEFLNVCYGTTRRKDPSWKRPDTFEVEPRTSQHYRKFRPVGDR